MRHQELGRVKGIQAGRGIPVDRRVRKVFARLAAAPATTTDVLASEQNISVSWLGQLIKRETGASLRACIIEQRMQRAVHLLRATELRIKEIAAQLGYAQTPSFVRIFMRVHGQSPLQYRRSMEAAAPTSTRPWLAPFCARCLQGTNPPPTGKAPQGFRVKS